MPERRHNRDTDSAPHHQDDAAALDAHAEQAALEALALRFRPVLLSFFRRRVQDRVEAEDLAQEVFLRMLQRGNIAVLEHARAYLFETASSVLLDRARRRAVRHDEAHQRFDLLRHGREDFPSERVLIGQEALDRASGLLLQLPQRTRAVFVLRRFEGLRYQDIARRLGISVSATEKHMVRAVSFLAERMGEE